MTVKEALDWLESVEDDQRLSETDREALAVLRDYVKQKQVE